MNYANVLSPGEPLDQSQARGARGCWGPLLGGLRSLLSCGTSPDSLRTSSPPGFDNLSAPPLGRTNPSGSPTGSHPRAWPRLWARLPKGTLPGAFNEGWYFPGRPWAVALEGAPSLQPHPLLPGPEASPHISLSPPESLSITGRWRVPFLHTPHSSGPHRRASAPRCVTAASLGGGAGCDWNHPLRTDRVCAPGQAGRPFLCALKQSCRRLSPRRPSVPRP